MTMQAITYRPSWRVAAAVLVVIGRGTSLVLAALVFLLHAPISPLRLIQIFSIFFLAPQVVAWLIQRALAATVSIEDGAIVLLSRHRRTEVPVDAIDHVSPWAVPLPAPGLRLRLRSGRRFQYGLCPADLMRFIAAVADAGAPEPVRCASGHPTARYARSKGLAWRRWDHPLLKFVVFALVPTLPLFRLHQYLAYGGTFGEYYQHGLKAYLLGFGLHWLLSAIHLVLYAAVLRGITEVVALTAAWVAPSREARVRLAAELWHRILYYGAVPVFLILRFWPW